MKKSIITGFVLSLFVLFTSCLGSGSNVEDNNAYGVVVRKDSHLLILEADKYVYSAELLSELNEGDCIYYRRLINYDVQESNEYLVAEASAHRVATDAMLRPYVDTANVVRKEFTIDRISPVTLIDGKLFFWTHHSKVASDQKNNFHIEYSETPETIDGKRVFNLFVRVVKQLEGEKTESSDDLLNVADISNLIQLEKSEGYKTLNIKFSYITELNSDSTIAKWGSHDLYDQIHILE